jgi:hypothetical protein
MSRAIPLLPVRAACRAVAAAFLLGVTAPAWALGQDDAAPAPAAEAAPADPVTTSPATDAPAAEAEQLETIPVDQAEAAPTDGAARYPYTFAAARLRHTELDQGGTDGIGIAGSYLLLPNVYAVAAITKFEADDANSTTSTLFELGGGYRQEIMAGMDLNATVRVLQDDIKSEPQSEVVMGLQADVGVRKQLLPQLEGNLALAYVERSRLARGFLSGSALYAFTPSLSVGAEIIASSNSTAYGVLGRWAF